MLGALPLRLCGWGRCRVPRPPRSPPWGGVFHGIVPPLGGRRLVGSPLGSSPLRVFFRVFFIDVWGVFLDVWPVFVDIKVGFFLHISDFFCTFVL